VLFLLLCACQYDGKHEQVMPVEKRGCRCAAVSKSVVDYHRIHYAGEWGHPAEFLRYADSAEFFCVRESLLELHFSSVQLADVWRYEFFRNFPALQKESLPILT
jgi:hypothetical protein